ncbi:hypothetical protein WR25_20159 [Diploscapter pachys]|uniref:Uncharacterized protein n=1 Tax=Diploscapter pachys TaxID=2018661 RepID=A0A2A2LE58_9BILA|nr:hypothetical protein WR25_20159 [Diploscapter pachys]
MFLSIAIALLAVVEYGLSDEIQAMNETKITDKSLETTKITEAVVTSNVLSEWYQDNFNLHVAIAVVASIILLLIFAIFMRKLIRHRKINGKYTVKQSA